MIGSQYGLTCPDPNPILNGTLLCKNLTIPACSDRTVYCTYPPDQYPGGEITVSKNPSPVYKAASGKLLIFLNKKVNVLVILYIDQITGLLITCGIYDFQECFDSYVYLSVCRNVSLCLSHSFQLRVDGPPGWTWNQAETLTGKVFPDFRPNTEPEPAPNPLRSLPGDSTLKKWPTDRCLENPALPRQDQNTLDGLQVQKN